MFQLDFKRAEVALAAGRLEDACKFVQQPVVREHRDGQRLIDKLIEALLVRASDHISLDRLEDARQDADLAFALGGRKSEVAEALKQIGALERKRIDNAIVANDFEFALATIATLRRERLADPQVARLVPLAVHPLAERGFEELATGRLDRAVVTDNLLAPFRHHVAKAIELHDQLKRCNHIGEYVRSGRHMDAERELSLLGQTIPTADWIVKARSEISRVVESIDNLLSGPIGLLSVPGRTIGPAHRNPAHRNVDQKEGIWVQPSSNQWLLQVDGVGRLLLHRGSQLTIGSAAASSRFDLSIQTDGLRDPVKLHRDGDDYFAESSSPFRVNDEQVSRKLLASGDHIAMGNHGRFRFNKSVPASASAVLLMTGAGHVRRDIRSVVMLADSLLFAKSGGHFHLDNEPYPIVVYCQGDSLAVRSHTRSDNGSDIQLLRVGESIVVGQTRFALAHNALP